MTDYHNIIFARFYFLMSNIYRSRLTIYFTLNKFFVAQIGKTRLIYVKYIYVYKTYLTYI